MNISQGRTKFQRKLASAVLLVFSISFLLPFLLARENRISPEIPWGVSALGAAPVLLLFIPPLLILIYAFISRSSLREIVLTSAGALGLLIPLLVLAYFGPEALSSLGSISRYSPASGLYVYISAVLIIYLMKPRMHTSDYTVLALTAVVIFIVGSRGAYDRLGILLEAGNLGARLSREVFAHIRITGISLIISIVIGIPVALISYNSSRIKKLIFPLLNILQTIPAIALFGLMIAPLAALSAAYPQLRALGIKGIGNTPAIIALSMYALYPVIRYSFTAFSSIETSVIQAGRGMGMNSRQMWRIVRFPLAAPGVLHGIRVALVQTIGNATLAKLIGGDGLGVLVFEGLGQASVDMVLLGMLLIIALTLFADRLFQTIIFLLTPVSLRGKDS